MSEKKMSTGTIILIIIGVVIVLLIGSCAICVVISGSNVPKSDTPYTYTPGAGSSGNAGTSAQRSYADTLTVSVLQEYTGSTAAGIIKNMNYFNSVPEAGETAYLLKVQVTCNRLGTRSVSDGATLVKESNIKLTMYGDTYYPRSLIVFSPEYPEFVNSYLSEGQSATGWVYYIVPTGSASLSLNSALQFESNTVQL